MIELREKDRSRICLLAQELLPAGSELWAYGSRVKGTCNDASDLDLALISPEGVEDNLAEFKLALQHSNIPLFVQVMPWSRIPEAFRQNILARYEVLYKVTD